MTTTRSMPSEPTTRMRLRDRYEAIVHKTLRVPRLSFPKTPGSSEDVVTQLDAVLLSVGFKLSKDLAQYLIALPEESAIVEGQAMLDAVRVLVGDHVQHNAYFIDFPRNVPDTMDFWLECVRDAIGVDTTDEAEEKLADLGLDVGVINLLSLPKYGRYQHTYEEMLAHHDELIPSIKDRVTVLTLGGSLAEESRTLYFQLAENPSPLGVDDLSLLRTLAEVHVTDGKQPGKIPVRENRAAINRARIEAGMPILVDTPVDVLRLAVELSDGDGTLEVPTRFRSFSRPERRVLMVALDAAVTRDYKLGDVARYREQFKRLGERLHPHEYPQYPGAVDVFAVARGDKAARSLAGRVDLCVASGQLAKAIGLLAQAPGMLIRNVDYLLRLAAADPEDHYVYEEALFEAIQTAAKSTSTRVLLSLREHLINRDAPAVARVFVNRSGRTWVTPDERDPLDPRLVSRACAILDEELKRLAKPGRLILLQPDASRLALPLSEKQKPGGFGILPRGSIQRVGNHVRFFVYWKESAARTDLDLSILTLAEDFGISQQVSWTNLRGAGMYHSGDVVESHDGASEFIDIDLDKTGARYVVPQVYVYSGENFDQVEEAFFGFMERDPTQKGRPFEPRTVRAKSDLFGSGRDALPLVFCRTASGWEAKWMHLNLRGLSLGNHVEGNQISVPLLAKSIVERRYLTLGGIVGMMGGAEYDPADLAAIVETGEPVIHVGLNVPEGLPVGSETYTPSNLADLIR